MGQVTIYLEKQVEEKMAAAAKSAHLSKSKWVARVIEEKITNEWPTSVADLAGAWKDFPSLEEIRDSSGVDGTREDF